MIRSLVVALSVLQASTTLPRAPFAVDVSALTIGAPVTVAELDLGKLKGDLRQIGWSVDGRKLYLQTVDGNAPAAKTRHYWIAIEGGAVMGIDAAPDWATEYWAHKSDRLAPGVESIAIDVEQKIENMKFGTGSAGAADRSSNGLGADNINSASNLEKAAESQHVNVVRLRVYGQVIAEFQNTQPIPGLTFSWGPEKSGAIAFTDVDGRLALMNGEKRRMVQGVHDALLPAWSLDGQRLAWVQRAGRKKYRLMYADVHP
jgi:hypothetical protein